MIDTDDNLLETIILYNDNIPYNHNIKIKLP